MIELLSERNYDVSVPACTNQRIGPEQVLATQCINANAIRGFREYPLHITVQFQQTIKVKTRNTQKPRDIKINFERRTVP